MSPFSTVHGGQHDTKYVTLELLLHVAFVADEIWGFTPGPARILYSEYVRVRQLETGSQGNEKVWLSKKIFRIKSRVNLCIILLISRKRETIYMIRFTFTNNTFFTVRSLYSYLCFVLGTNGSCQKEKAALCAVCSCVVCGVWVCALRLDGVSSA